MHLSVTVEKESRIGARSSERIVSKGRATLRSAPEYEAAVAEARDRITAEYAPLIAAAGPVRRQILRIERRIRLRRAIDSIAPRGALYATHREWHT